MRTHASLKAQAETVGVVLTESALDSLAVYYGLLEEWNQKINLTTVSSRDEVYERHFLDSLSVAAVYDVAACQSLIDVGTGAGFPGIVLAIAFPQLRVTLLESIVKKTHFLSAVIDALALQDRVQVVCERAETLAQNPQYREQYELAVARAVARLNVLCELCLPFVQLGGSFIAWKGAQGEEEAGEAQVALKKLGGSAPLMHRWETPDGKERFLIQVDKTANTPAGYPRRVGLPVKRPLV